MANWYCSHVKWSAVAVWTTSTSWNVGDIRRQTAAFGTLTAGNERVFRCTTAGLGGVGEPTWVLTKAATTTDNLATWTEVTGNETWMFVGGVAWTAPHARLITAASSGWVAAGDTVYVAGGTDHNADTQAASTTIAFAGSKTSPIRVLCVTAQTIAPVQADITTGAKIITTGNIALILNGYAYVYGIEFDCATGAVSTVMSIANDGPDLLQFDTCVFSLPGTSGGRITIGNASVSTTSPCVVKFLNCTVTFAAAGQGLVPRGCTFYWYGGSLTGTVPTALIAPGTNNPNFSIADIRDVDLNSGGTWTTKFLVNLTNIVAGQNQIKITNCKLATTLGGVTTGTLPAYAGALVDMICTDDTTNVLVREAHYRYQGSMVSDTAVYRTGGATDGTTVKSWKIVTLASSVKYEFPFECPDIAVWVNTTGSHTFRVYFGSAATTFKDTEVGLQIEYMGATTSPLGTIASTLTGILAAGANLTTDATSTWNGGVVGVQQYVQVTQTVNAKGWVRIRPIVTTAGSTLYIDPSVEVDGVLGAQQSSMIDQFSNTAAAAGAGMLVHPGMAGGMRG